MVKKIISIISIISVSALTVLLTSCGTKTSDTNANLQVYTSFYAMSDFAKMIGGDKANVYTLCPTGSEPHDFEPTPQDIANLTENANVFIYNGMGMEEWTDSVLSSINSSTVIAVEASKNISHISANEDPHVWLDPNNAYAELSTIADAFTEADPQNADYYEENLSNCKEKIDNLINDYETAVASFTSKNIVVSHDAYSTLCERFGITEIPVGGIDNEGEPTPTRIAEVHDFIKNNNIKYIFGEPLGTNSIIESIASDTGCSILILDPFEGNIENKDYFTVMSENLDALKTALN